MVAIRYTSLFTISTALLSSYVSAYGMISQIVDANNFCVFLPPTDSTDRIISNTEWNAQAFCLGDAPKATNAGTLPSGFIQSAHYLVTDDYVQVTGQIDPTKANLDSTDDGGQYDVKAPTGSSCAGWKYYVNLIEPSGKTYCIRCCNDTKTCNRGISEKGCAHIIPGDYSGPYGGGDSSSVVTTTTKKSTTTTVATTKKETTTTTKKTTTTTMAKETTPTVTKTTSKTTTTSDTAATSTVDDDNDLNNKDTVNALNDESSTTTNKEVVTTTTTESPIETTTTTTTESPIETTTTTTTESPIETTSTTTTDAAIITTTTPAAIITTTTPAAVATTTTSDAGATSPDISSQVSSENDKITEQSVNAASALQPTMFTVLALFIAIVF